MFANRAFRRWLIPVTSLALCSIPASAAAWPLRPGLEVQGGWVVAGTDLGAGSVVLDSHPGSRASGRIGLSLASRASGPVEWRTGVAFQQWDIRSELEFRIEVTPGSYQSQSMEITQTVRELAFPFEARLRPAASSPWFLDLGPELDIRLGVRQRAGSASPGTESAAARREVGRFAPHAEIFEDVGTFGGTSEVGSRFQPVAVSVAAGIGRSWGRTHPMHASVRISQALLDQERESDAVVRPTRIALAWGVAY